jgi:beta-lactamase class D
LRKKRWLTRRGFVNPEVERNQHLRGLPPDKRGFWECWSATQRVHRWMDETVKWTHLKPDEIARLLGHEGIEVSMTVVDYIVEETQLS